jgi:hypothetical protein
MTRSTLGICREPAPTSAVHIPTMTRNSGVTLRHRGARTRRHDLACRLPWATADGCHVGSRRSLPTILEIQHPILRLECGHRGKGAPGGRS